MVDAVMGDARNLGGVRRKSGMRRMMQRKSTIAFLMALPLMLLIGLLVLYPAFYAVHLAMLNKSMQRFVGLSNFTFLFKRETFWLVDPSYSAFNWILNVFGYGPVPWTGDAYWARFSVILINVWYGAPFFLIMYLAALKSVPGELYEAAEIDGASAWQRFLHITLPMMRNILAITVLFSLIVTFANFDIVRIMTAGGPRNMTHMFATYAFKLGIESGDIPLGASVSLFMFPILALSAVFILRGVRKRGREIG